MLIDEIGFGIEIEMYNISRRKVADILKSVIGGRERPHANAFTIISKTDKREWTAELDRSIHNEIDEPKPYNTSNVCELITPILTLSDLPVLKDLLYAISSAGGKSDSKHGCAVHLHIGFDNASVDSLKWLCRTYHYLYKEIADAFGLSRTQRMMYSQNIPTIFIKRLESISTSSTFERYWYRDCNPSHPRQSTSIRYNKSRYHIVNLHSFYKGTGVELRQFKFYGDIDFDKLVAYIYFGLGMIMLADKHELEAKSLEDILDNLPDEKEFVREHISRGEDGREENTIQAEDNT